MNRAVILLALLFVSAVAAACGGDDEGTTPTGTEPAATATSSIQSPTPGATPATEACSATTLPRAGEQAGLPPAVADMREQIIDAAIACDYDGLEQLALNGQPSFSYSFSEPAEGGQPGQYWRNGEENGDPVLSKLVEVLTLEFVAEAETYYRPAAFRFDPQNLTQEQRQQVDDLLAEHGDIAAWVEGTGYTGYRAAITANGDWTFFVAGD